MILFQKMNESAGMRKKTCTLSYFHWNFNYHFVSFLDRVFEEILLRSRNDLQQAIVAPSGVTIFIPINQAFSSIPAYTNLLTNQSLINQVPSFFSSLVFFSPVQGFH